MSLPKEADRRKAQQHRDVEVRQQAGIELPDVSGLSNADAAQMYAKAGLHVLPIKSGTKNPGSYLGHGWPARASDDLDTVRDWWRRWPGAGIAIHVGGSELLVIDVDRPELIPEWMWPHLERAVFRATTNDQSSRRGHYFYRLRPEQVFGCGRGRLKPPNGKPAGFDIKCGGGAIVLGPSDHPRAAEGGQYATGPVGTLALVPDEIAAKLNSPADGDSGWRMLTPIELDEKAKAFLERYTDEDQPAALESILRSFNTEPGERHPTMFDELCWAMREAKARRFSAQRAADELRELWTQAAPGREDDFNRALRDAIARADADGTVDELRSRADGFASMDAWRGAQDGFENWAPTMVATPGAPGDDGDAPSWAPIDIRIALNDRSVVLPDILKRSDGPCLFYRGRVHSVHGETESGKSWLVQCATAECLLDGEPVLYIDFEDSAGAVAERLIRLGVPAEIVESPAVFVYVHPEAHPSTEAERAAFDALLNGAYSLVVVDGVTDSMGLFGLSGNDAEDVARWHRLLPKAIAHHTGAAVVCVDHVAKDSQTRGRFALGSQHKIAGLSGAAYVVEMEQPFAVGQAGRASVRVGKDRPGQIRGLGGRWRKSDRTQHVADLRLDSTDAERTTWVLDQPAHAGVSTDMDDAKSKVDKRSFRPTWFEGDPFGGPVAMRLGVGGSWSTVERTRLG